MNGLIIKVLSISIAVVIAVYLIIYESNTMITKMFSVCIVAAMVLYWIVYERNTRKRKKQEVRSRKKGVGYKIRWFVRRSTEEYI